jgi:uncharacterized protein (DUF1800 family)
MNGSAKLDRRQLLGLGTLGLAGMMVAGCGESLEQRFTKLSLPIDPLPPASTVEASPAMRILSRVAYGPRPGDIARVERMGHEAYIAEQLNPEKIAESAACKWRVGSLSDMLNTDTGLLFDEDDHRLVQALRQATTLRAVYSSKQLFERVAEFWSDHFNIYAFKGQGPQLKVVDDQSTIRKYAMGRFRDLLGASARSAAMLGYLDNTVNRKGVPNENYAREIMELHTLGVHGGYTQHDVKEVARCFTGWTSDKNWHRGRFLFDTSAHDDGAKQVLGITIPAGGGIRDGEHVLDILAKHPATAHHLATKLCIRFLGDAQKETVLHVASAFLKTGGDIRETLRALLTPQNLIDAPPILKRPYDYAVSALRALNADTDCGTGIQAHLESMGQPLFGWPMPNGYPEEARSWVGGLVPRWNFALALAGGSIENTSIDLPSLTKAGADARLSPEDSLLEFALGLPATEPLLTRLRSVTSLCSSAGESAALVLMSPEFQWR